MKRTVQRAMLVLLAAGLAAMPAMSQDAMGAKEAKDAGAGSVIVITEKDGGRSVNELCRAVAAATDARFMLDEKNPRSKQRVEFASEERVPRDEALPWLRSVLYLNGLVLVPVRAPEENLWMPVDANSNLATAWPEYVEEKEIGKCRDMVGVYVVTTILADHLTDTSRARNAIAQLITQRVGRISDVPGAKGFVIGDYGPTVYAAWKLLKAMDTDDQMELDPRTGRPVPPAAEPPAPVPTKPTVAYYEDLLAKCETETAAKYFVARINALTGAK